MAAAAAASDRRSSISSFRSTVSRNSVISDPANAPPTLAAHRPSSPFRSSSAGSARPIPTPKDRLPPQMTPKRKPVQHQKSPLSSEAFSSPTSAMPGGFPNTPGEQHEQAYTETSQSTPGSNKGSKRLSSMRSFLPFKSLRKSYEDTSPSNSPGNGMRPTTPGADSILSTSADRPSTSDRPSLRKKISGTFWKRKSSLGTSFTAGSSTTDRTGDETLRGPETYDLNDNVIMEDSRPATPALNGESTLHPGKVRRKSATFWRRKSSLTLAETMNAEKQGWGGRKSSDVQYAQQTNGHGKENGNGDGNGYVEPVRSNTNTGILGRKMSKRSEPDSEPDYVLPPIKRSYSPPPQLPEFLGAGGGLDLGEDFFTKDYVRGEY